MNACACRVDEDAEFCSRLLAAIKVWERYSPDASSIDPQAHNLLKALLRQGVIFGNWHMNAPTQAFFMELFRCDHGEESLLEQLHQALDFTHACLCR